MNIRNLTCIGCPVGCALSVEMDGAAVLRVSGNNCGVGAKYAAEEVTAPKRTVTSTVSVEGGAVPVTPVKTACGVPKERVMDCVREIKKMKVRAPVYAGDCLCSDLAGTGVALIVTKTDAAGGE